jgi:Tfp pilus assembly protein PilN
MININLIPKDLIPKKRNFLPHLAITALAVILLLWYGGSIVKTYAEKKSKEERIQFLKQEISKLDFVEEKLKEQQRQKALVADKEKAVSQITSNRTIWAYELRLLAGLIPPKAWIDKLELAQNKRMILVEAKNPKAGQKGQPDMITKRESQTYSVLRITGYALSPSREEGISLIGELISNMRNDENFSLRFLDPEMRTIERKDYEGETVMKFVIECEIAS